MKKYQYKVQGVDFDVEIQEVEGNIAKVNVNGIPFEVELQQPINAAKHPTIVKPKVAAPAAVSAAPAAPTASPAPAAGAAGAGSAVKSPLPGTITSVNVKVGDTVAVGDTLVVLEAMKMQNNIESEYAGTVTAVNVAPGDVVMEGGVLLSIG